jgi:hypothetical protein
MDNEADAELVRRFKHMLDYSTVESLKKSLELIFQEYLLAQPDGVYPNNFTKSIEDYYNLLDFIKAMEKLGLKSED